MGGYFIGRILEMSLIGSYCILLVLPIRLLLLKCERKYAYYLWLAVFLNLSVPFAIQSRVSLIPRQVAEFSSVPKEHMDEAAFKRLPEGLKKTEDNRVGNENSSAKGLPSADDTNQIQENMEPFESVGWRQRNIVIFLAWFSGVFCVLSFNLVHVFSINRQISKEKWVCWDSQKRIAEVEGLSSPFLWGIFRPIIFLPAGLVGEERTYIIAHESIHRKRKDPVLKIVIFLITVVHWFNPVVWAAWTLFCRDMEISCDEAVLADTGENIKKQYAQSLLRFAAAQNGYLMMPLTFGEPSAKTRIKNILYFHKPGALITGMAGLLVVIVALGLTVRPVGAEDIFLGAVHGGILQRTSDKKSVVSSAGLAMEQKMKDMENASRVKTANKVQHRDDYTEAAVTHVQHAEDQYFTPGLRQEEELDTLAQRALQELYDLTGFRVSACVYDCTDLGSFFFARTKEDLEHSRCFYNRDFGGEEGYEGIPSMYIVSARRCWYSDVEQLDAPENAERMEDGEMASWFLKRSAVYQGEELSGITEALPGMGECIRVMTVDGSFYEVTLDRRINGVSNIYGPYPEGFEH